MTRTSLAVDERAAPYRAMPLWGALPPDSGASSSAPGFKTQPFSPRVTVVERPPAAARKTAGQPAEIIRFVIPPAEISHQRVNLSPYAPAQRAPVVAATAKAEHPRGLGARAAVAIVFNLQSGLITGKRLPPGRELKLPPSFVPEPHIQEEAWRATLTRPSDLITPQAASLPFLPLAGTASRIARPQLALRELVVSPLRASSCDRPLTPATSGVHIALPAAGTVRQVVIQDSGASVIWKTQSAEDLPSNCLLREPHEFRPNRELSLEPGRTPLSRTRLKPAVTLFPAGLTSPFPGSEPTIVAENPPVKFVSTSLPSPRRATGPRPVVALPGGLVVWSGVLNSYVRRIVCSPRLHEYVRDVHALRLTPAKKVQDEYKIPGALLCSSTETLPISDSGGESPAKGEVNGKPRIEYADPRRA